MDAKRPSTVPAAMSITTMMNSPFCAAFSPGRVFSRARLVCICQTLYAECGNSFSSVRTQSLSPSDDDREKEGDDEHEDQNQVDGIRRNPRRQESARGIECGVRNQNPVLPELDEASRADHAP